MTSDEFSHFLKAQESNYAQALNELRAGTKRTHWMWFIFPQVRGLGSSPMAVSYSLESLAQANRYLCHPILGQRLLECSRALLLQSDSNRSRILGEIDALKLRSSMTLFSLCEGRVTEFQQVLEKFYDCLQDPKMPNILRKQGEL